MIHISGYVLKQSSPSCGMEGVKVHDPKGTAIERTGIGIFARVLMETEPLLPVVEETQLNDPVLREHFLARVLVYHFRLPVAGVPNIDTAPATA